jgi:hypothetical protein
MQPYKARAQRYRDDAEQLAGDPGAQGISERLLALARYCESIMIAAHNPPEDIAGEIAHWLETVFGSPMYQTTATIVSVITGQEISERKVRTWMAAPFGSRRSKSHPAKKGSQHSKSHPAKKG